jgi:hypothetical protein
MLYEVGYVILIPLAAILFMNIGRHPGAGICAAFSGITFGYGGVTTSDNTDILGIKPVITLKSTNKFEIVRVGADIKIRCVNCSRVIMLSRIDFNKGIRKVIGNYEEEK